MKQRSLFIFIILLFQAFSIHGHTDELHDENPPLIQADIIVYGDEIPGIAEAVMSSRAAKFNGKKTKILLIRPNKPGEMLGGVITRGGLAYLDRNQILEKPDSHNLFSHLWQSKSLIGKGFRFTCRILHIKNKTAYLKPSSDFYRELLARAEVKKISIDPVKADKVLRTMLKESNIQLINQTELIPFLSNASKKKKAGEQKENTKIDYLVSRSVNSKSSPKVTYKAKVYVDATQNADLARAAGLQYSLGFDTLGYPDATLPVTPVFMTHGLRVQQLQKLEESILSNKKLLSKIELMIRRDNEPKVADWLLSTLEKEMIVGEDYVDVRSIALGGAFHEWSGKPYTLQEGFIFDRPNIAILDNGALSWNAFLYKMSAPELSKFLDKGISPRDYMLSDMQSFEQWLRKEVSVIEMQGNIHSKIKVISPQELYIRHHLNILDVLKPLAGRDILRGGNSLENSIGTFSYFFDVRGGIDGLGGKMPKPIFNFGIEHSLTKIPNLAVIGRSAGYYGLAPAIGRILELNISIGAYIGLAAWLAIDKNKSIQDIKTSELRHLMKSMTGKEIVFEGKDLTNSISKEALDKIK